MRQSFSDWVTNRNSVAKHLLSFTAYLANLHLYELLDAVYNLPLLNIVFYNAEYCSLNNSQSRVLNNYR